MARRTRERVPSRTKERRPPFPPEPRDQPGAEGSSRRFARRNALACSAEPMLGSARRDRLPTSPSARATPTAPSSSRATTRTPSVSAFRTDALFDRNQANVDARVEIRRAANETERLGSCVRREVAKPRGGSTARRRSRPLRGGGMIDRAENRSGRREVRTRRERSRSASCSSAADLVETRAEYRRAQPIFARRGSTCILQWELFQ